LQGEGTIIVILKSAFIRHAAVAHSALPDWWLRRCLGVWFTSIQYS